jgi:hypothetical protein
VNHVARARYSGNPTIRLNGNVIPRLALSEIERFAFGIARLTAAGAAM